MGLGLELGDLRVLAWTCWLSAKGELAAVDELLERGGVVLIEGGAGIGKTALLEAACRRAAA